MDLKKLKADSSDESEDEIQKIIPRPQEIKKKNKNGALWKEMLEEESLMDDMKTCEVARNHRKRKIDRGAESYDYEEEDSNKRSRNQQEHEPNNSNFKSKKKWKSNAIHEVDRSPIHLNDLLDIESENLAEDIASNLNEQNLDLIKKVITAIGREESIKFYKKTQKVERNGGLLTVNKQRRRTSGGIFLFLIKTSNSVTAEQKDIIFDRNSEG